VLNQTGQAWTSDVQRRARALLLYLRYLRYVEPAPTPRGQPVRYVPTTSFVTAWRKAWPYAVEPRGFGRNTA